jgi:hypothetical protein
MKISKMRAYKTTETSKKEKCKKLVIKKIETNNKKNSKYFMYDY